LYDCDFMLDKNKSPKIIEINPRLSGSAVVSIEAGVPFIDDLISLVKNQRIPKAKISYGSKIIAYKSLIKR